MATPVFDPRKPFQEIKPQAPVFDPKQPFEEETNQLAPIEIGSQGFDGPAITARGLMKGTAKAIPLVAGGVGGFLGTALGPAGTVGGAGLGYAGGKSIENAILAAMEDQDAPQSNKEIWEQVPKNVLEGAKYEMGGQAAFKGAELALKGTKDAATGLLTKAAEKFPRVSKKVGEAADSVAGFFKNNFLQRKENAEAIEDAARRLGTEATPGMTSSGYMTQKLEDTMQQSPTIVGSMVRNKVEPTRKAMQGAADDVLSQSHGMDAYQSGEVIKGRVIDNARKGFEETGKKFDALEESFPFIEASERQLQGTVRRIMNNEALKVDAMGTMNNLATKISDQLGKLRTVSDINKLKSYVGKLKGADANEKKFLSDTYNQLDNLVQNSVKLHSKNLTRQTGDKVFQEEGRGLLKLKAQANKAYKNQRKQLEEVAGPLGVKVSRRDTPEMVLEKLQGIKGENVVKKIFNPQDQRTMQTFASKYPELFNIAKGAELGFLKKKSTKDAQVQMGTFFSNLKNMPENAQKMLFGKDYQKVKDMQTLWEARTPNFNPSGTASGVEWSRYADPLRLFGIPQEAGRLGQYALYRGAPAIAKGARAVKEGAKTLGEETSNLLSAQAGKIGGVLDDASKPLQGSSPALGVATKATGLLYGQAAQPAAEMGLKAADNMIKGNQDHLLETYEQAKADPSHPFHKYVQENDPQTAMAMINMAEGMAGGVGSIKNIGKGLVSNEKLIEAALRKTPSFENEAAQKTLDRLAKATDPKEIEEVGLLAKQKLGLLENPTPNERPERMEFAAQWARDRRNKRAFQQNFVRPLTEKAQAAPEPKPGDVIDAKDTFELFGGRATPKGLINQEPSNIWRKKSDSQFKKEMDSITPEMIDDFQKQKAAQQPKPENKVLKMPGVDTAKDFRPKSSGDVFIDALDEISSRYGDKPPKTLLKAKELSAKGGGDEPYMFGDSHNIQWGNSKAARDAGEWNEPYPMPVRVKDLKGVLGKGVPDGSGADPFMWMDSKYGATKEVLKAHVDKPLKINTRSDLIARDDYIQYLNPNNHKINIHIPTLNDHIVRLIEPGSPSVKRRLNAVKKLADAGFDVTVVHDDLLQALDIKDNEIRKSFLNAFGLDAKEIKNLIGNRVKLSKNNISLDKNAASRIERVTGMNLKPFLKKKN